MAKKKAANSTQIVLNGGNKSPKKKPVRKKVEKRTVTTHDDLLDIRDYCAEHRQEIEGRHLSQILAHVQRHMSQTNPGTAVNPGPLQLVLDRLNVAYRAGRGEGKLVGTLHTGPEDLSRAVGILCHVVSRQLRLSPHEHDFLEQFAKSISGVLEVPFEIADD